MFRTPHTDHRAIGQLQQGQRCLQSDKQHVTVILQDCNELGVDSEWTLHSSGQLVQKIGCLTWKDDTLSVMQCIPSDESQQWLRIHGTIVHSHSKQCLENLVQASVGLSDCRRGASSQLWSFSVEVEQL